MNFLLFLTDFPFEISLHIAKSSLKKLNASCYPRFIDNKIFLKAFKHATLSESTAMAAKESKRPP